MLKITKAQPTVTEEETPIPKTDWSQVSDSDKLTFLCENLEQFTLMFGAMSANASRNPLLKNLMGL